MKDNEEESQKQLLNTDESTASMQHIPSTISLNMDDANLVSS